MDWMPGGGASHTQEWSQETLGLFPPAPAHSILLQTPDAQAPKRPSPQQPTGKPTGMCRISFTLQLGLNETLGLGPEHGEVVLLPPPSRIYHSTAPQAPPP